MRREKRVPGAVLESNRVYVGFDESNHGRFPEIFVSTFSLDPIDANFSPTLPKRRHHPDNLLRLIQKDYSFVSVSEEDYHKINDPRNPKYLGIVLASLLKDKIKRSVEELVLFLDGDYSTPEIKYAKNIVSEICSIPSGIVVVKSGPSFDQSYPIVNFADELAHYLFRKCNEDQRLQNTHRQNLLASLG